MLNEEGTPERPPSPRRRRYALILPIALRRNVLCINCFSMTTASLKGDREARLSFPAARVESASGVLVEHSVFAACCTANRHNAGAGQSTSIVSAISHTGLLSRLASLFWKSEYVSDQWSSNPTITIILLKAPETNSLPLSVLKVFNSFAASPMCRSSQERYSSVIVRTNFVDARKYGFRWLRKLKNRKYCLPHIVFLNDPQTSASTVPSAMKSDHLPVVETHPTWLSCERMSCILGRFGAATTDPQTSHSVEPHLVANRYLANLTES